MSTDARGAAPPRIGSLPTGAGRQGDESHVYELTLTPTGDGVLVHRYVADDEAAGRPGD